MSKKIKAVFNWSGGKDSALALRKVLQQQEYEIVSLLTTVNNDTQRSTMHSIPTTLFQKQADSIGIPLHIVNLVSDKETNNYQSAMDTCINHFKEMGVTHFIFGDIHLHDVKSYREKEYNPYGITVVEPLWDKSPDEIINEFLASGLQTIVITTMSDILDKSFIGHLIDKNFIEELPIGTDPCGENGEYHTFCYAGDIFKTPISFSLGDPYNVTYPFKLNDGTEKSFTYWFANLYDRD